MEDLTPKQTVAWRDHLKRPELRRHLFYGGARSGKTDVILTWLCIQAAKYPGARIGPPTCYCHEVTWYFSKQLLPWTPQCLL